MDGTIRCPICGHNAEFTIYPCAFGTEEEYISCNTCGYSYEFAYGAYRIYVGKKCFIWNHTINPNKYRQLDKKISKAEFMARRNWKKFRKKTNSKNCPI